MTNDPAYARNFAALAHGSQLYGDQPYIVHLQAVARELRSLMVRAPGLRFYDRDLAECAAYLHDVLEDTSTTRGELEAAFGPDVADLVHAVTDEPGRNRKERKAKTYPKIRACGPLAVALKLADRIANVRAVRQEIARGSGEEPATGEPEAGSKRNLLGMYRKEQDGFAAALYGPEDGLDSAWGELRELLG